jgi:hypothetical protein
VVPFVQAPLVAKYRVDPSENEALGWSVDTRKLTGESKVESPAVLQLKIEEPRQTSLTTSSWMRMNYYS